MKYIGSVLLFLLFGFSVFAQGIQEDMLLAAGIPDDDPRVFMESLLAVEDKAAIRRESVDQQLQDELRRIERGYIPRFDMLEATGPELWETDGEFVLRIKREREELKHELQMEKADVSEQLKSRDLTVLGYLETLLDTAETRYWEGWEFPREHLVLDAGEYDRNQRIWHMSVGSTWRYAEFDPVEAIVSFSEVREDPLRDFPRELTEFQDAVHAGALEAEASWAYSREMDPVVFDLLVRNTLNSLSYPLVLSEKDEPEPDVYETPVSIPAALPKAIAPDIPALLPQKVSLGFTLGVLVDRESGKASVLSMVRPVMSSDSYEFGFQFLIHQNTAVEMGSNFMGDRSGLLQFIDHFSVGREGDFVRLSAGFRSPFSLGTGTVISRLSPLGQAPELRRVPFVGEVPFGEVFVDDLAAPALAGIRLGIPSAWDIPVSAGVGAVMDFGLPMEDGDSSVRRALLPFADLTVHVSDSLALSADCAVMMLVGDGTEIITHSFYSGDSGLYNFFVRLGAETYLGGTTLRGGVSAGRGELLPGLYGWQHYRYRSSMMGHLFDDSVMGNSGFSLSLQGEVLYRSGSFHAASHVSIPLMQMDRALVGAELGLDGKRFSLAWGGEGPPLDLLGEDTFLYGRTSFSLGGAEVACTASASPKGFSHISLETGFSTADGVTRRREAVGTRPSLFGEVAQGFAGDFSGGTFYGITSLSAGYDTPSFGFALSSRFIYEGDPFLWNTLYDVRKEHASTGLWNLGSGLSGFVSVMDVVYDLLSLISRVRIGSPGDAVLLSAGQQDPYTMGTGTVIHSLDPKTDLPMITRVPVLLQAGRGMPGFEFFLDDLTYPAVSALRLSLRTSGEQPLEFGAGAAADFGNLKTYGYPFGDSVKAAPDMVRSTLFIPFADARVPVYRTGDFTAEAAGSVSVIMPIDQDLQVEGFTRYSVFAGARLGFSDRLMIQVGPSAVKGGIRPGQIGRDYYRHRDDLISGVFSTSPEDLPLTLGLFNEMLYRSGGAEVSVFADLPSDAANGTLGVRGLYTGLLGEISAGVFTSPGSLSFSGSRFYLQGVWNAGAVQVTGSLSGGAGEPAVFMVESSVFMSR